jgi:hypothetical protein
MTAEGTGDKGERRDDRLTRSKAQAKPRFLHAHQKIKRTTEGDRIMFSQYVTAEVGLS